MGKLTIFIALMSSHLLSSFVVEAVVFHVSDICFSKIGILHVVINGWVLCASTIGLIPVMVLFPN